MAENIKITALDSLNQADNNDVLPIVDVDASTTKKITKSALFSDFHSDISSLATELGTNDSDISSLAAVSTIHSSDISSLATELGTNDSDISSLAAVSTIHSSDISSLAAVGGSSVDLSPLDSDISSLATAVGTNDSDISSLAAVSTIHSSDISSLAAVGGSSVDLSPLNSDISSLASVDLSHDSDVSSLSASIENFSVDVDTPLNIALRGTNNIHMGAFPEQSFKVVDNPKKSVMVVSDEDGNLTYILKESTAEVRVALGDYGTPNRFALASDLPSFVLENDSGEPDIEVTDSSTGDKISVISGDSDSKGANGLPIRQGYNFPDMGAFPSPLLISGGTID